MFRILLLVILCAGFMRPVESQAQLDPEEKVLDSNAHPTTEDLYKYCKEAANHYKEKDELLFMESKCGVFMQGVITGLMIYDLQNGNQRSPILSNCQNSNNELNPSKKIILYSMDLTKKFLGAYQQFSGLKNVSSSQKKYLRTIADSPAAIGWSMLAGEIKNSKQCGLE